jgi:hypothetical protein
MDEENQVKRNKKKRSFKSEKKFYFVPDSGKRTNLLMPIIPSLILENTTFPSCIF